MNADERLTELFTGLPNFERTRTIQGDWSLDKMTRLLESAPLGDRPDGSRWVQVGGSKGKGTTTLYLESMATAMGLRCGVFTSPHLTHVTERVRIDGRPVAAADLAEVLEAVLGEARTLGLVPSFFEVITLAAVRMFCRAAVDLAVFEVGLGGRLDATTAVPVDGSILTRIEREHTELLGATRPRIAVEKAFVIRPGRPVWFTRDDVTDGVFRDRAAAVGALVQAEWEYDALDLSATSIGGALVQSAERRSFALPGASRFELPALALAYPCLRYFFPERSVDLLPVARPRLPGRFEVVRQGLGRTVILDGAHTPGSMRCVADELKRRFAGVSVAVLFATAKDKQWREGLTELLSPVATAPAARVLVTTLSGTPGEDPEVITQWLASVGWEAEVVDGPADGLRRLLDCAAVGLVVGSFYLVGAVRDLLDVD